MIDGRGRTLCLGLVWGEPECGRAGLRGDETRTVDVESEEFAWVANEGDGADFPPGEPGAAREGDLGVI